MRSIGVRSADLRIGVFDFPNLGAGLGIQSNEHTVVLLQEDLAIAKAQTTANVVAAQNCLNGRVLLREVGPYDLLIVVQVKCVNVVRESGVEVRKSGG